MPETHVTRGAWRISASTWRDSSRRPASPSASDTGLNPLVAARAKRRRLHGQEPLEITCHQQRLSETRGDVRVEPACLGVRGDGLVVESTVATRVDEPREQLRIVAVAVGLAQQTHERSLGLTRCPPPSWRRTCAPRIGAG